jgi:hypothetical protein
MITTAFKPGESGAEVQTEGTPVVPQAGDEGGEDNSFAVARVGGDGPSVTGDFQPSDYEIPRMGIVQASSDNPGNNPKGSITFNNTIMISDGGQALTLVVLRASKVFVENVEYEKRDKNAPMRQLLTVDEVMAAGGTLIYDGKIQPTWRPQADMLVAIQGTDDLLFNRKAGGKLWALCTWRLVGMGFTWGAKTVFTAALAVNNDVPELSWQLTTKGVIPRGRPNKIYVPVLKMIGRTPPEAKAELLAMIPK